MLSRQRWGGKSDIDLGPEVSEDDDPAYYLLHPTGSNCIVRVLEGSASCEDCTDGIEDSYGESLEEDAPPA